MNAEEYRTAYKALSNRWDELEAEQDRIDEQQADLREAAFKELATFHHDEPCPNERLGCDCGTPVKVYEYQGALWEEEALGYEIFGAPWDDDE